MPVRRSSGGPGRVGRLAALLLLVAAWTGCATLGPPYQPLLPVPAGRAVIYFYRPDSVDGAAVVFNIRQGDQVLGELQNGSYFPQVVSPGLQAFWARTETRADVRVIAEAGRSYYVRASLSEGTFLGRPVLEVVSTSNAAPEIGACHLVSVRR